MFMTTTRITSYNVCYTKLLRFHDRGLLGAYRTQNAIGRHPVFHEDRDVPDDRREFGERFRLGERDRADGVGIQLENLDRPGEFVLVLPFRVEFADPARRLASYNFV